MGFAGMLTTGNQSTGEPNCCHELGSVYRVSIVEPKFAECYENKAGETWGYSVLLSVIEQLKHSMRTAIMQNVMG